MKFCTILAIVGLAVAVAVPGHGHNKKVAHNNKVHSGHSGSHHAHHKKKHVNEQSSDVPEEGISGGFFDSGANELAQIPGSGY